jgi:murein DD-endopeptidase MepM/ murein hydrolase activator NlpD
MQVTRIGIAAVALIAQSLITGCKPAEPEAQSKVKWNADPFPDPPAPTIVDSVANVPIAPPVPAPISNSAQVKDTVLVTAPFDLAVLGASMTVPVQGVARAQLRDTYTEKRGTRVHEAIDILAARGTPVLSATDGRLLKLFNSKAGGLMVYAADKTGHFILLYGHLDRYAEGMTNGMPLKRGQVIGYVGTSGNAPPGTPHLHFGVLRGQPAVSWSKGDPVNPYLLLVPKL